MNIQEKTSEKLILALDGMDQSDVFALIDKLPDLLWVKVGLELFVTYGPQIICRLRDKGKKVFLDLKFHDIPNTVSKACFKAAQTGADFISIHACAGSKALKLSNQAVIEGAAIANLPPPTLLAITMLTSWEQECFNKEITTNQTINERVAHFASLAFSAGIRGCVCSPHEVQFLRKMYPYDLKLITPGIRSFDSNMHDQVRVMNASTALKKGADLLVVGRLITESSDPLGSFENLCKEIIDSY